MKEYAWLLCVTAALFLALPATAEDLTTQPESISLKSMDQPVTVQVFRGGAPVNIEKVNGHQFNVAKNTYEYMVTVTAQDGKLVIKPTNLLEIGSYVLTVNTNAGQVVMDVYATLSNEPDSLEARAKRAGVSTEEMKTMLGLSSANNREAVELNLPPLYYEGQTLVLTMPPNDKRTFTWTVNGKVVREGVNANELVYTFKQPGDYVVTYIERENGQAVASGIGSTTVSPLPPTPVELSARSDLVLQGPDGYRKYTWNVNGKPIGNAREMRYTFPGPGIYEVEVIGEDPAAGPYDQFSRTRYRVTVK